MCVHECERGVAGANQTGGGGYFFNKLFTRERARGGLYYQSVRDTGNESRESKRHYSLLVLSPLARRSWRCQHAVLVDLDVVVIH